MVAVEGFHIFCGGGGIDLGSGGGRGVVVVRRRRTGVDFDPDVVCG